MCNALGIITYNDSSVYVEGMQKYRPIAGFSFLGRYRLVDFAISNMSNSGIDDIQIYVNGNPRSLIDHVGTGRHYNINSKHGHLSLVPVYTDGGTSRFTTDISCYAENIHAVMENHNDYVVIAPANMLYKGNYEELLKQHIESGAEVSVLYQHVDNAKENYIGCDVIQMNKQRGVLSIEQNLGNYKSRYLSLQTYIMSKEIFKTLVEEAQETSSMYWFKDILNDKCVDMDIRGLNYRGHIYVINDLKSYYESNMEFLTEEKMKDINDPEWPVYTRTSDSAPAIYLNGGTATGSLISNGCEISGVVKNSIVGRSCKIGKDALIENCIIMPDVEIADGAHLKNVIVDKHSKIAKKKDLAGLEEQPLYIGRRENV